LRELDRTGISQEQVDLFQSLFEPGATVFDDICPVYSNTGFIYPYQLVEKKIEKHISDIRTFYPAGLHINISKANIDYSQVAQRKAKIAIAKNVWGDTKDGDKFENTDTLILSLTISADFKSVKISGIESRGYQLKCPDDFDCDGVRNSEDGCVYKPGPASAQGCPDTDKDGIADHLDNCPEKPNPKQKDKDGDGTGDTCDPCPDDPKNDVDGDGVCGTDDNCPNASNPDQNDADKDGDGDACDICPNDKDNDKDGDGVCGDVDICPNDPGKEKHQGCPDSDGDNVPDYRDACPTVKGKIRYLGCETPIVYKNYFFLNADLALFSGNMNPDAPQLSSLNYTDMIEELTNGGTMITEGSGKPDFALSASVDYFSKEKVNLGASIGVSYQQYSTNLVLSDFHTQYRASDAQGDYRRLISGNHITETLTANYLTFPLLFKYRKKFGIDTANLDNVSKWGLYADAGIALTFLINGESKNTSNFNYEALYYWDPDTELQQFNNQVNYDPSEIGWLELIGNKEYLDDLREESGYDLAIDNGFSGTSSFKHNFMIEIVGKVGLSYDISDNLSLLFGTRFSYGMTMGKKDVSYQITDKIGDYTSLMEASEKLNMFSAGINIGVRIALDRPKAVKKDG
jgi:hypothetical protein